MFKQLFVNLPVADLPRSRAFFESMGLGFDPRFSNEQGACLVLGEQFFAMLLTRPFFEGFTPKPIADATQVSEVLLALACGRRAEVDQVVADAVAAGATTPKPPVDLGFMYQHGFADLDGHQWEVFWMDGAAAPA